MRLSDYFSDRYAEARQRFVDACRRAGAHLRSHGNTTAPGPSGNGLWTDVARIGDARSGAALVLVSGTHGIEGFAGSACQLLMLDQHFTADANLPATVYLVHALNPFGFANERRVNERNVDLNRNFVDHAAPPPNPAFAEIHDCLLPRDGTGPGKHEADRRIAALAAERGQAWLQEAITRGQYTHRDGLFYGGAEPEWSNRVLRRFVNVDLARHERVAVIDLHTGLGEPGRTEIIFRGPPGSESERLAGAWYGPQVTSSERGDSSSTVIVGNTAGAIREELSDRLVVPVTLEFGTHPPRVVLEALRAEHWLHHHGAEAPEALRAEIREQFREAFCCASRQWRDDVLQAGEKIVLEALAGVAD